jgi:hypothetical protein
MVRVVVVWVAAAMVLASGVGLLACKGGNALKAPKSAGDATTLAGTMWEDKDGNTVYSFDDEEQVSLIDLDTEEVRIVGTYTVDEKGVVNITAGLQVLMGSWDGTTLKLEGKQVVKQAAQ